MIIHTTAISTEAAMPLPQSANMAYRSSFTVTYSDGGKRKYTTDRYSRETIAVNVAIRMREHLLEANVAAMRLIPAAVQL